MPGQHIPSVWRILEKAWPLGVPSPSLPETPNQPKWPLASHPLWACIPSKPAAGNVLTNTVRSRCF